LASTAEMSSHDWKPAIAENHPETVGADIPSTVLAPLSIWGSAADKLSRPSVIPVFIGGDFKFALVRKPAKGKSQLNIPWNYPPLMAAWKTRPASSLRHALGLCAADAPYQAAMEL